jgi:hypothetical protein
MPKPLNSSERGPQGPSDEQTTASMSMIAVAGSPPGLR